MSIAVVIPLFNKEDAIASTITSVLEQTRKPDQLIIIDDGSSDESAAIVRRVLQRAPANLTWTILAQPRTGVSAARNRGAEASSCEYIAFLDADDEWHPNCLAELETLARAFPSAGILSVRLAKRVRDGRLVPEPSALGPEFFGLVGDAISNYSRGYGILSSSSVMLRREAWREAGGFPVGSRRGEDIYLWLKMLMMVDFAHSGRALSIWRDEHSGIGGRKGTMPFHLTYFLRSDEGRQYLSHPGLRDFLEANLLRNLVFERLLGHQLIARRLRRLARSCSLSTRVECAALAMLPLWLLSAAATGWRKAIRSRGARQSSSRA